MDPQHTDNTETHNVVSSETNKSKYPFKKIGLYAALGCFGWEYTGLSLEKHAGKQILKPSYILTKTYNVAEVYFFKAGQLLGVCYNGAIIYVKKVSDFIGKFFGNFFHYLSLFVNDVTESAKNICRPIYNLLKVPAVTFSGFYQKVNESSPVDLKYIPITVGLLGSILFGAEYCALSYEQNRQKNDPQYAFKYKPSVLLGHCSKELQTKFTRFGGYLGDRVVQSYTFVKNIGTYVKQYYVKQYYDIFVEWFKRTFEKAYTSVHNICSPTLSIIASPFYATYGYLNSFKIAGLNINYGYMSMFLLSTLLLPKILSSKTVKKLADKYRSVS